jgi:Condensation domain
MGKLSKRIFRLSPIKLELLARRLGRESKITVQEQIIPRRPKSNSGTPLSFAQERLWFLDQFEQDGAAYNIPRAFLITGALNIRVVEQCFSEIVRRHEVLHTAFKEMNGVPEQVISKALPFKLTLVNLSELSVDARVHEVTRLAVEEAQIAFDLTQGLLMRASVLQIDDNEAVCLFTLHHIISDAWSTGILVKEWIELYKAFSHGRPSPLSELPIQYADFACWQRQWMQGKVLEDQLAYWKRQLGGASAVLKLPADKPRPHVQSYDGARQSLLLSRILTESIKAFAKRERVTLFTLLLASFYVLLHYYSGQRDILVGTPAVNRSRRETEGLIGFFVNILILRMDLSGNPTFLELLARARDVVVGAYTHQDVPFEKVVKALRPTRSLEQMPLAQVAFLVNNAPFLSMEVEGLSVRPIEADTVKVRYEMIVHAIETAQGLSVAIEYKTDLFSLEAISRVLANYEALLMNVVARPESTLQVLKDALNGAPHKPSILLV